jgi:diguanylate cyclase (GGDEF)-like protein
MEHLRPGDLFGRLGGEEFGVLLTDCGRDQALAIADRIRLTIVANPLAIDGEIVTISASVGVSFTINAGHDLQQLCREADAALYRAKRSGRNRVMADTEDDGLVQA